MTTYLSRRKTAALSADALAMLSAPVNGQVLTSDANGNATWQAIAPIPPPSSSTAGFVFNHNAQYTNQGAGPQFTRAGNTIIMYVTGRVQPGLALGGTLAVGTVTLPGGSSFVSPANFYTLGHGMTVNRKPLLAKLDPSTASVDIFIPNIPGVFEALAATEVSDFTLVFNIQQP